jgi:preprotein translocase subunit SecD
MRRLVGWIAGVLIFTSALGGCAIVDRLDKLGEGDSKPTATAAAATLSEPLQLRQVTALTPPPCASGQLGNTGATECYKLAEESLNIVRVKDIKSGLAKGSTDFGVVVTLYPDDAKAFGELTGRLAKEQPPRNQVAVVVDDKVVTAPAVMEAITGGEIQIVGSFTKKSAEDLVKQLTG